MPSPQPDHDDAPSTRRATPGDAPQVARLLRDFNAEYDQQTPDPETLESRYEELIRSKEMIVLLVGEGPDGFAQLRFRPWVHTAGVQAYLEKLYVAPDLRGNGFGKARLETAIETACSEGADFMEVG